MVHNLQPSVIKLLTAAGIDIHSSRSAYFSIYNTGIRNAGSVIDLLPAVKFRLTDAEQPIILLSFHAKDVLQKEDIYGILSLPGTVFIQLPCSKESILQVASKLSKNLLCVKDAAWKTFSENACKKLLQMRYKELAHFSGKSEFQLGNKILNPLRSTCSGMLSYPNSKEDYLPLFQKNFEALYQYMAIPLVEEFLQWCVVCKDSETPYLQDAFDFASHVKKLSQYSTQIELKKIISLIDQVNDSFKKLQPE